eukprot:gene3928-4894_t
MARNKTSTMHNNSECLKWEDPANQCRAQVADDAATVFSSSTSNNWCSVVTPPLSCSISVTLRVTNQSDTFYLGVCEASQDWDDSEAPDGWLYRGCGTLRIKEKSRKDDVMRGDALRGDDRLVKVTVDLKASSVEFHLDGAVQGKLTGLSEKVRIVVGFGGKKQKVTLLETTRQPDEDERIERAQGVEASISDSVPFLDDLLKKYFENVQCDEEGVPSKMCRLVQHLALVQGGRRACDIEAQRTVATLTSQQDEEVASILRTHDGLFLPLLGRLHLFFAYASLAVSAATTEPVKYQIWEEDMFRLTMDSTKAENDTLPYVGRVSEALKRMQQTSDVGNTKEGIGLERFLILVHTYSEWYQSLSQEAEAKVQAAFDAAPRAAPPASGHSQWWCLRSPFSCFDHDQSLETSGTYEGQSSSEEATLVNIFLEPDGTACLYLKHSLNSRRTCHRLPPAASARSAFSLATLQSVDVNQSDTSGVTALQWAAAHGHEAVVGMMLRASGVVLDAKDGEGMTAFMRAVEGGHVGVAQALLGSGCEVGLQDDAGATILVRCAARGDAHMARALVEAVGESSLLGDFLDCRTFLEHREEAGQLACVLSELCLACPAQMGAVSWRPGCVTALAKLATRELQKAACEEPQTVRRVVHLAKYLAAKEEGKAQLQGTGPVACLMHMLRRRSPQDEDTAAAVVAAHALGQLGVCPLTLKDDDAGEQARGWQRVLDRAMAGRIRRRWLSSRLYWARRHRACQRVIWRAWCGHRARHVAAIGERSEEAAVLAKLRCRVRFSEEEERELAGLLSPKTWRAGVVLERLGKLVGRRLRLQQDEAKQARFCQKLAGVKGLMGSEELADLTASLGWVENSTKVCEYAQLQYMLRTLVGLEPVKAWVAEQVADAAGRFAFGELLPVRHVLVKGELGTGKKTAAEIVLRLLRILSTEDSESSESDVQEALHSLAEAHGVVAQPSALGAMVGQQVKLARGVSGSGCLRKAGAVGRVVELREGSGSSVHLRVETPDGDRTTYDRSRLQLVLPSTSSVESSVEDRLRDLGVEVLRELKDLLNSKTGEIEVEERKLYLVRVLPGAAVKEDVEGRILWEMLGRGKRSRAVITGDPVTLHRYQELAVMKAVWPSLIELNALKMADVGAITAQVMKLRGYQLRGSGSGELAQASTESVGAEANMGSKGQEAMLETAEEIVEKVVESPHNYLPNMDEDYKVMIPGASKLTLHFDPRCVTESGCDYVSVRLEQDACEIRRLDGPKGDSWTKPLEVAGNEVHFHFHSDGSNEMWGFRVAVKAAVRVAGSPSRNAFEDAVQAVTPTASELVAVESVARECFHDSDVRTRGAYCAGDMLEMAIAKKNRRTAQAASGGSSERLLALADIHLLALPDFGIEVLSHDELLLLRTQAQQALDAMIGWGNHCLPHSPKWFLERARQILSTQVTPQRPLSRALAAP